MLLKEKPQAPNKQKKKNEKSNRNQKGYEFSLHKIMKGTKKKVLIKKSSKLRKINNENTK